MPLSGGFVGLTPVNPWRLGAVLFAASDSHFVAVQKAKRPGYEFSDRWALPGGMIRVPGTEAVADMAREALVDRVRAETGLEPDAVAPRCDHGPVMTSYTVKGERRYTLVATFCCGIVTPLPLCTSDSSIQAADWLSLAEVDLSEFAPANRLVLAHILWTSFDRASRDKNRSLIEAALQQCNKWAADTGVAPTAAPWAHASERAAWRLSWPC